MYAGPGQCASGSCAHPLPQLCSGGFACSAAGCNTTCVTNSDCTPAYFCESGSCHLKAIAITAGGSDTCALLSDATVRCWGFTARTPVPVNVPSPVTAISAGYAHTCVLLVDQTVACWGLNQLSQLGNDSAGVSSTIPVSVTGVSNAIGVSAGGFFTCALITGGAVKCWGDNRYGQLGTGMLSNPAPAAVEVVGVSAVLSISCGNFHSCAIRPGGQILCWGNNEHGQLGNGTTMDSAVPGIANSSFNPVALSVGGADHTCATLSTGSVWCWGSATSGELGYMSVTDVSTPVPSFSFSGATSMAAGTGHTCALLADTTVECSGMNSFGQLGNGSVTDSFTSQVVVNLTGARALAAGPYHTCALLSDGSVWCWGQGTALGRSASADSPVPIQVDGW
jgi:alpha-tubulin suppressor-like RCC1 family protein